MLLIECCPSDESYAFLSFVALVLFLEEGETGVLTPGGTRDHPRRE